MKLDGITGITKGSYTVNDMFCRSQLITCNRVKECNGVCPFEDALKHADQMQTMNEQHTVDHDRDWIIWCIEHDGFIHTHRFDKANQIILDALQSADRPTGWIPVSERLPEDTTKPVLISGNYKGLGVYAVDIARYNGGMWQYDGFTFPDCDITAWMPLPKPYDCGAKNGGDTE